MSIKVKPETLKFHLFFGNIFRIRFMWNSIKVSICLDNEIYINLDQTKLSLNGGTISLNLDLYIC